MADTLAKGFWTFFLVTAPALLLVRFIWPTKFPWWVVITAVAIVSWGSLVLGEHFSLVHESECKAQVVGGAIEGCPIVDHWYTYNRELGWLKGLIYLVPWLALFGAVKVIRRRRA